MPKTRKWKRWAMLTPTGNLCSVWFCDTRSEVVRGFNERNAKDWTLARIRRDGWDVIPVTVTERAAMTDPVEVAWDGESDGA